MSAPLRRFGWPPARKRPIDLVRLQTLPLHIPTPPPSLADLKTLFAHSRPHCVLLGQSKPLAIIDSESDIALSFFLDAALMKAAASLGVPLSGLTVALTELHHDPGTGRSWRALAMTA